MKKAKNPGSRRLDLNREAIRLLQPNQLHAAVGGVLPYTCPCPTAPVK